jgi:hypothetical protein
MGALATVGGWALLSLESVKTIFFVDESGNLGVILVQRSNHLWNLYICWFLHQTICIILFMRLHVLPYCNTLWGVQQADRHHSLWGWMQMCLIDSSVFVCGLECAVCFESMFCMNSSTFYSLSLSLCYLQHHQQQQQQHKMDKCLEPARYNEGTCQFLSRGPWVIECQGF